MMQTETFPRRQSSLMHIEVWLRFGALATGTAGELQPIPPSGMKRLPVARVPVRVEFGRETTRLLWR